MFCNKSKKRNIYYDHVVRLYYDEGMGNKEISQIFPINTLTFTTWIHNFAKDHPEKVKMRKKQSSATNISGLSDTPDDIKSLKAEIKRLKHELAEESLRADA